MCGLLSHKIRASKHLPVSINLRENVSLNETHIRSQRFVIIDAEFFELLWIIECVFTLSCILYEFVREDLDDLGSVDGTICEYLPFIEIFLRVELNSKEGIVFGSERG